MPKTYPNHFRVATDPLSDELTRKYQPLKMQPALNTVEKIVVKEALPEVQRRDPMARYLTIVGGGLMLILLIGIVVLAAMIYQNTKINTTSIEAVPNASSLLRAIDEKMDDTADQINEIYQRETQLPEKVELDITYHIGKLGQDLKEHIVVSGNEQIITTRDAKIIYDYGSKMMITKFVGPENNACFVTSFNFTGTIDGVKAALLQEKSEEYVDNITDVVYEDMGVAVNKASLSTNAKTLCEDSNLVMLRPSEVQDGEQQTLKRSCSYKQSKSCRKETYTYTVKKCKKRGRKYRCKYYKKEKTRTICNTYSYKVCY